MAKSKQPDKPADKSASRKAPRPSQELTDSPGTGSTSATGEGTLRVVTFAYPLPVGGTPADHPLANIHIHVESVDDDVTRDDVTAANGECVLTLDEGRYTVSCQQLPIGFHEADRSITGGTTLPLGAGDPITVESQVETRLEIGFFSTIAGPTGTPNGNGTRVAVQELATFPLLTEEIDGVPSGRRAGQPAGGSASRLVDGALRDALGWRPRPSDPRGFVAALTQSFACYEVQGHTECRWVPRTSVVQAQADLGAITGAQASLYNRAKAAVDASLPLLDGLVPLDPAYDRENVDATRSIVRSSLTDLVAELGVEGGPRVSRVDELFLLLLATTPATTKEESASLTAETVQGQLGLLRERFGLESEQVNTIEEEQNFTNFIVLFDWVHDLFDSWQTIRPQFTGTSPAPFLGTQLVLISRQLAVIGESVDEVEFSLDSVFVGAAERSTLRLEFEDESKDPPFEVAPPLLVSELLEWVRDFATEEGPRLVQDAGKDGVVAFTPVLDRLRTLVRGALLTENGGLQDRPKVPAGFRTARVQNALAELAGQLDVAHDLAKVFKRPLRSDRAAASPPAAPTAPVAPPITRPTSTTL